jgi:putative addiction module component (TIGR02574 family)
MLEKPENIAITPAQREELERRWVDLQENPDEGESWTDVKDSLLRE